MYATLHGIYCILLILDHLVQNHGRDAEDPGLAGFEIKLAQLIRIDVSEPCLVHLPHLMKG